MPDTRYHTLCILGCGNMGSAILGGLIEQRTSDASKHPFQRFIACVRSTERKDALERRFGSTPGVSVWQGDVLPAIKESDVIVLSVDVADVSEVLGRSGMRYALCGKLLISVVAGRVRRALYEAVNGDDLPVPGDEPVRILRVLPNIAAAVSESITAVEIPESPELPAADVDLAVSIFDCIGRTVRVPPGRMNAATAVGGSTPAFFAVLCDALVDAALAVGVPRGEAQTMIYQAMRGTAALLQSGTHPGVLKDHGTSPEGCTIGGLMVLEEAGVRGHVGRALREAVTIARLMETVAHVNDTRQ